MKIKKVKLHIVRQLLFATALLAIGNICFASVEERTPTIDKKSIRRMMKKAVPMIEDITGRDFKKKVKFKLVKRDVLVEAIRQSAKPLYKKLMKGEDDDAVERQIENVVVSNSKSMLGLYDPEKRKFFVVPENIEHTVEALGIEAEDFNDVVFLIVAHELVHALDDQYFDLKGKMESLEDIEALQAYAALREGHAVYVTNEVSERLRLSETAEEISVKSAAGVFGAENRAQAQIYHNTYVKGAEFVRKIAEERGAEGVDDAFISPPVLTSQIMDPEEYLSPSGSTGLDCSMMLENIRPELPIEGMQTQSLPLGTTSLSTLLISQGISEIDAHAVAKECLSGAILIASRQTLKPKTVMVMALDFRSRKSAQKLLEISKKTDASAEAQFNAKLNSTYRVVKEEERGLEGFDNTRFRQVEKNTNGVVTTEVAVEGLADTAYIAVMFGNMLETIEDREIEEIFSALGKERLKLL